MFRRMVLSGPVSALNHYLIFCAWLTPDEIKINKIMSFLRWLRISPDLKFNMGAIGEFEFIISEV